MNQYEIIPNLTTQSLNRMEVFNAIRGKKVLSRSELAKMVSASRATVSGIVNDMLKIGLLAEIGEGESTGGRPPIQLQYCPNSKFAIGLLLYDSQVQAVLTNLEGNPIEAFEVPVEGITPERMLSTMKDAVDHIFRNYSSVKVVGIGVGAPGIVNFENGVIESSISMGWLDKKIHVKEHLENAFKVPVYVANRSRIAALGELNAGIGRGISNLIYLFLGQGIVAGIVIDKKLYFGTGFDSGEIGHVSIAPDGPLCPCGNRGCLEVFATEKAILAFARSQARAHDESFLLSYVNGDLEKLKFKHVVDAARAGDPAATNVISETGTKIGFAVATLINLFAPQMVILGGPIGKEGGDLLLNPVIGEIRNRTNTRSYKSVKVVNGNLGIESLAIGAANLAINNTPIDILFRE